MQNYLFIIMTFLLTLSYGQDTELWNVDNDTVSGGKFVMDISPELKQSLLGKEKSVCKKSTAYVSPKKPLSPADRCAKQNKIMGFKIQIFYTRDRNAANKVKNDFSRQHPSLTPELVYASPDYRILVGDYFNRKSAQADLRRIQKSYPSAFTVQWRVWCRKAI